MFRIFSEERRKLVELECREGRGRGGEGRRWETVRKTGGEFFGLILVLFKHMVFNSVHGQFK